MLQRNVGNPCPAMHRLHTSQCPSKYDSGDQVNDEIGWACCTDRREERWYRVLVGKSEEMRPHGKPMRTVEDNIKIGLTQTGWEDVD